MDQESNTEKKDQPPNIRIPSPGSVSVSSINSLRPLEWDSGADIGYRNIVQTDLSTVERIAIANRTSKLEDITNTSSLRNPLAQSTPFIADSSTSAKSKPLVDYSMSGSFSVSDALNLDVPAKKISTDISRSLEDVRRIERRQQFKKSRSSQNMFQCEPNQDHASSSSVVTLVSQGRKCSNKSIQVDDGCFVIHEQGAEKNSTYTVFKQPKASSESNAESVDGGSFEYFAGSDYNRNIQKSDVSSTSDVNTLCNEVLDGVDLVTKYVNNLGIRNKHKVMKKVAESLMKNVSNESKDKPASGSTSSRVAPAEDTHFRPIVPTDKSSQTSVSGVAGKPSRKCRDSSSSAYDSTKSTSNKFSSDFCTSDIPSSLMESRNSESVRSRSNLTSDYGSCVASCAQEVPQKNTNAYLKKYLEKEREAQLLWIKSGIDHLNNLKRLYENQKTLRNDVVLYKKSLSSKSCASRFKCNLTKKHSSKKPAPATQSPPNSDDSRATYDVVPELKNTTCSRGAVIGQNKVVKKITVKKYSVRSRKDTECSRYECKKCHCYGKHSEENKENIDVNKMESNHSTDSRRSQAAYTGAVVRKPISYTVLFEQNPAHRWNRRLTVKQHTTKKYTNKVTGYRGNIKTSATAEGTQLKPVETETSLTLQEYLAKNKPDYINRAEHRRQCLSEIAQLRDLRDKSKKELMSLINEYDEKEISFIRHNLPPPPLRVLRIFNDKTLRKQTEMKYQQLPEVQMKKLEIKRKENSRRNQIMAKVFTKKLQKKVLRGQVNLSNNVSVISS